MEAAGAFAGPMAGVLATTVDGGVEAASLVAGGAVTGVAGAGMAQSQGRLRRWADLSASRLAYCVPSGASRLDCKPGVSCGSAAAIAVAPSSVVALSSGPNTIAMAISPMS